MSAGDVEQKVADRFRELFHSSWASAVDAAVIALISIWLYLGAARASFHHVPTPLPLTWWRTQLAQLGIHYPRWLDSIAGWHARHDAGAVLLALVIAAVGATTGARRSTAPGFRMLALLILLLSSQWFGLGRTMAAYWTIIAILVAAALCILFRTWLISRRGGSQEEAATYFSPTSIVDGFLSGPATIVFSPVVFPFIFCWSAVSALGYDQRKPSDAAELLERELADLEKQRVLVGALPAATAVRVLAGIQLVAASPATHRRALAVLRYRGPSGARATDVLTGPLPDRSARQRP